ncbi:MAG TPA: hypothetical protein VGG39_24375 [Polyangiaceae bacterium]
MSFGWIMNEASSEFLDPDLLRDAEATNQRPALSPEGDELTTTVRPPLTPPPPPMAVANAAPLPSFPPPSDVPSFTLQSQYPSHAPHPSAPPLDGPGAGKPSWLRSLLTTTFPPPGVARNANPDAPIRASTAGAVFAALGVFFAFVALVCGLRGAPTEIMPPVVAASVVIARALVAFGAGALSFAFLRQAERLLVQEPPRG